MSANIRFGPTRTFCLDFEANLHGSSYLPTYYLYRRLFAPRNRWPLERGSWSHACFARFNKEGWSWDILNTSLEAVWCTAHYSLHGMDLFYGISL
jgi:hypothetical protein